MAQLSISAAARAVGKDRGTLHRYIKSGKLSVTKNAAGNTVVETAELLRVFGPLQGHGGKTVAPAAALPQQDSSGMQHVLESTLQLLKEQLRASQEREERLLMMLGQEQEARRELERRLLPPGTEQAPVYRMHSEGVADQERVLIPDPPRAAAAHPPTGTASAKEAGKAKKGFLATLFGK